VVAVGAFWGLNPVAAAAINGSSAILAELNSLRSLKTNPLENGFLGETHFLDFLRSRPHYQKMLLF
jgi:hypothetical protein